ncbi:MAG TPA: energy transducer TonB [Bacteroidota bacterium]|nr:energy transducer TonB [Bacteroidota bacterium]
MPIEMIKTFSVDYGANELKIVYQKFLTRGLLIAAALHLSGIGGYWGTVYLAKENEPVRTVRILKYSEMGPPPSITNTQAAPAIAVSAPTAKPSVGIPVAVPDAEVNPEQTIATQQELSQAVNVGEGDGSGGAVVEQDIQVENDEPPEFVPFEKYPEVIKQVHPKYPDIALRAGIEGTVFVKVWVDKEGKVRKAVILKSDGEVLNQAAIEAVQQWVFTPALMNNGPVSVWITVPIRFRLQGR